MLPGWLLAFDLRLAFGGASFPSHWLKCLQDVGLCPENGRALSWPLNSGKREDGNGTISLPGCEGRATVILFWLRFLYALLASQKGWPLNIFIIFKKIFHASCLGPGRNVEHFLIKRSWLWVLSPTARQPGPAAALCWVRSTLQTGLRRNWRAGWPPGTSEQSHHPVWVGLARGHSLKNSFNAYEHVFVK